MGSWFSQINLVKINNGCMKILYFVLIAFFLEKGGGMNKNCGDKVSIYSIIERLTEDHRGEKVNICKSTLIVYDTIEDLNFDTNSVIRQFDTSMLSKEEIIKTSYFRSRFESYYSNVSKSINFSDTISLNKERIGFEIYDTELYENLIRDSLNENYFNFNERIIYKCLYLAASKRYLIHRIYEEGNSVYEEVCMLNFQNPSKFKYDFYFNFDWHYDVSSVKRVSKGQKK